MWPQRATPLLGLIFSPMKNPLLVLTLIWAFTFQVQAQENLKDASEILGPSDFSKIFTSEEFKTDDKDQVIDRMEPLGYFGDNYQRIFIHFISVVKNNDKPSEYYVYGKSKLKNNICDFQGTISIEQVSEYIDHEFPKYRRGEISGTYVFHEDQKQKGTGKFVGDFRAYWLLNEQNEIEYDGIMFIADGFTNNEFEGQWVSHSSGSTKKCNWGDYRIPDSSELDGGAGEFYPDDKYHELGWRTYVEQWNQDSDPNAIKARKTERAEWWK